MLWQHCSLRTAGTTDDIYRLGHSSLAFYVAVVIAGTFTDERSVIAVLVLI